MFPHYPSALVSSCPLCTGFLNGKGNTVVALYLSSPVTEKLVVVVPKDAANLLKTTFGNGNDPIRPLNPW